MLVPSNALAAGTVKLGATLTAPSSLGSGGVELPLPLVSWTPRSRIQQASMELIDRPSQPSFLGKMGKVRRWRLTRIVRKVSNSIEARFFNVNFI